MLGTRSPGVLSTSALPASMGWVVHVPRSEFCVPALRGYKYAHSMLELGRALSDA